MFSFFNALLYKKKIILIRQFNFVDIFLKTNRKCWKNLVKYVNQNLKISERLHIMLTMFTRNCITSVSFQTFCGASIKFQTFLYRHLKLSSTLENSLYYAIHLMRWLTNFYDFRFKWTATAGIGIHPTKAWLSRLVNFKNAIWTWGHFRRTICNKILF